MPVDWVDKFKNASNASLCCTPWRASAGRSGSADGAVASDAGALLPCNYENESCRALPAEPIFQFVIMSSLRRFGRKFGKF